MKETTIEKDELPSDAFPLLEHGRRNGLHSRATAQSTTVIHVSFYVFEFDVSIWQAQNVGDEKSLRVLADIMETMFDRGFLDEIFSLQPTHTRQELRQSFEQIAHSSVMRLNEQRSVDFLSVLGFRFWWSIFVTITVICSFVCHYHYNHFCLDCRIGIGYCNVLM